MDLNYEMNCSLCNFEGESEGDLENHIDISHPEIFSVFKPEVQETSNNSTSGLGSAQDQKKSRTETLSTAYQGQARGARLQVASFESNFQHATPANPPRRLSKLMTKEEQEGINKIKESYDILLTHQRFECNMCSFFSTNVQILGEHQEKKHGRMTAAGPNQVQGRWNVDNDSTLEKHSNSRKRSTGPSENFGLSMTKRVRKSIRLSENLDLSSSMAHVNHEQANMQKNKEEFKSQVSKAQADELLSGKSANRQAESSTNKSRLSRIEFNRIWKQKVGANPAAPDNKLEKYNETDHSRSTANTILVSGKDVELKKGRQSKIMAGDRDSFTETTSTPKNLNDSGKMDTLKRGRKAYNKKQHFEVKKENAEKKEGEKGKREQSLQAETIETHQAKRKSNAVKKVLQTLDDNREPAPLSESQMEENGAKKKQRSCRKSLAPKPTEPEMKAKVPGNSGNLFFVCGRRPKT